MDPRAVPDTVERRTILSVLAIKPWSPAHSPSTIVTGLSQSQCLYGMVITNTTNFVKMSDSELLMGTVKVWLGTGTVNIWLGTGTVNMWLRIGTVNMQLGMGAVKFFHWISRGIPLVAEKYLNYNYILPFHKTIVNYNSKKKFTPWSSLPGFLWLSVCTHWQLSSARCGEHDPLPAGPSLDSSHARQI